MAFCMRAIASSTLLKCPIDGIAEIVCQKHTWVWYRLSTLKFFIKYRKTLYWTKILKVKPTNQNGAFCYEQVLFIWTSLLYIYLKIIVSGLIRRRIRKQKSRKKKTISSPDWMPVKRKLLKRTYNKHAVIIVTSEKRYLFKIPT